MAYENGGCGPFEEAQLNKVYRGVKLQSNGAGTDLTIESHEKEMVLHLEPGEVHSGNLVIKSGTILGLIGYIP